jgi:hypothetical protein
MGIASRLLISAVAITALSAQGALTQAAGGANDPATALARAAARLPLEPCTIPGARGGRQTAARPILQRGAPLHRVP